MTETERKAAIKEESAKFETQYRLVDRLVCKTKALLSDIPTDYKSLEAAFKEYIAAIDALSDIYDLLEDCAETFPR